MSSECMDMDSLKSCILVRPVCRRYRVPSNGECWLKLPFDGYLPRTPRMSCMEKRPWIVDRHHNRTGEPRVLRQLLHIFAMCGIHSACTRSITSSAVEGQTFLRPDNYQLGIWTYLAQHSGRKTCSRFLIHYGVRRYHRKNGRTATADAPRRMRPALRVVLFGDGNNVEVWKIRIPKEPEF